MFDEHNPYEARFTIPQQGVGLVIGKGGQRLKDIHIEYNVKAYIDKDSVTGKRIVVMNYTGVSGTSSIYDESYKKASREALERCYDHIRTFVIDQLGIRDRVFHD